MPQGEFPVVYAVEHLNEQLNKFSGITDMEFDYVVSGNGHSVHLVDTELGNWICLYTDAAGFRYVDDAEGTVADIISECTQVLIALTQNLKAITAIVV